MNASDLRAVASDIRAKVDDVRRRAEEPDQWYGPGELAEALDAAGHSEMGDVDADAEHIAAWHPGVALAVAEWLDLLGSQEECDWSPEMWARAVAFVKAWRGESS